MSFISDYYLWSIVFMKKWINMYLCIFLNPFPLVDHNESMAILCLISILIKRYRYLRWIKTDIKLRYAEKGRNISNMRIGREEKEVISLLQWTSIEEILGLTFKSVFFLSLLLWITLHRQYYSYFLFTSSPFISYPNIERIRDLKILINLLSKEISLLITLRFMQKLRSLISMQF